jgi:hypothetical protein
MNCQEEMINATNIIKQCQQKNHNNPYDEFQCFKIKILFMNACIEKQRNKENNNDDKYKTKGKEVNCGENFILPSHR